MASCRRVPLVAVFAWLAGIGPAPAHRWYPAWCCNDHDCRELEEDKGETVLEEPDGWHLWDGRVAARQVPPLRGGDDEGDHLLLRAPGLDLTAPRRLSARRQALCRRQVERYC